MKSFYLIVFTIAVSINIFSQSTLDTIEVKTGWNLIGSLASGNAIEIINSIPTGIISSSFFGFSPDEGYQVADTLHKGKGYWVKVTQDGKIIIGISTPFVCGLSQIYYYGESYNTVQIGSQCWLKENLNVGIIIYPSQPQTNNSNIEKYCYGNDPSNCNAFGGLYQWNETMQYNTMPGSQGICPDSWHIPTYAEFLTFLAAVSNNGNTIKAVGQGTGSGAGTNTSGFSTLLAGLLNLDTNFYHLGIYGYFWSSTEYNATNANLIYLTSTTNSINLYNDYKEYGLSVRCLKD